MTTISMLVEDKLGVLARVATLLDQSGVNIRSLVVEPSESLTRITLTIESDSRVSDLLVSEFEKLVNCLDVSTQEADTRNNLTREGATTSDFVVAEI